ncbi:DUF106 domain-containing protein [Candidatus Woesearchaeota archaeon]|nr:DUF106 domain-containing protein [Candidatus Woesearchaeota archaeon]
MGLFNMLDPLLDGAMGFLLKLSPLAGLVVVSLVMTLFITLIYKFTTDQVLLKELKENQKKVQAEMRKHKDNPKKVMELQKKAFAASGVIMRQSMKSMIYTFIPIIILFGWVSAHFAYTPISVGDNFSVMANLERGAQGTVSIVVPEGLSVLSAQSINITDGRVGWLLIADNPGDYQVSFEYVNDIVTKRVVVEGERGYLKNIKTKRTFIEFVYGSREESIAKSSSFKQIIVGYQKLKPWGSFSLFGYKPGWLFTYIIFSIIGSTLVRKWFKVH